MQAIPLREVHLNVAAFAGGDFRTLLAAANAFGVIAISSITLSIGYAASNNDLGFVRVQSGVAGPNFRWGFYSYAAQGNIETHSINFPEPGFLIPDDEVIEVENGAYASSVWVQMVYRHCPVGMVMR
jgi:hypothetical protein